MRRESRQVVLLFVLLWILYVICALECRAGVVAPSVQYPADGTSGHWINPVVFWSAMTESPACAGNNCTQRDAQIQIADDSAFGSGDIVWENWSCAGGSGTGCAYGGGFSIVVDEDHGDFQNALSGQTALAFGTQYWIRLRQQTRNTGLAWSNWSSSSHDFTTHSAYAGTTWYVRTDGDNSSCDGQHDAGVGAAPDCAYLTISKAHTSASAGDVIEVRDGTHSSQPLFNWTLDLKIHGQSRTGTVVTFDNPQWQLNTSMWLDNITIRSTSCAANAGGNRYLYANADQGVVTNTTLGCGAYIQTNSSAVPLDGWIFRHVWLDGNGDGTAASKNSGVTGFPHGHWRYLGVYDFRVDGRRNCFEKPSGATPQSWYHYELLTVHDCWNHSYEMRGTDYLTVIRAAVANNAMGFGEGITMPLHNIYDTACSQYVSVENTSTDIGHSFGWGGIYPPSPCTGTAADIYYFNFVNNAKSDERAWGVCSNNGCTGPSTPWSCCTTTDDGDCDMISCDENGDCPSSQCNVPAGGDNLVVTETDETADRILSGTQWYVDYNIATSTGSNDYFWDRIRYTSLSAFRASDCDCADHDLQQDPELTESQGWGSTELDHTPATGSPCIDGGDPAYDPKYAERAAGIADGAGGTTIDVGSVEVAGASPACSLAGASLSGATIQ